MLVFSIYFIYEQMLKSCSLKIVALPLYFFDTLPFNQFDLLENLKINMQCSTARASMTAMAFPYRLLSSIAMAARNPTIVPLPCLGY